MARNQEKQNNMLNRVVNAQNRRMEEKRPHLASLVGELHQCERWRSQILSEIGREVAAIQNAALGEHTIRTMNDHINKLFREKHQWELQIKSLGGRNYLNQGAKELYGQNAVGTNEYMYFGAAKELPGVRELFEQRASQRPKRKRGELYAAAGVEYFGYKDEDDARLLDKEREAEQRLRAEAVEAYKQKELEQKKLTLAGLGMNKT